MIYTKYTLKTNPTQWDIWAHEKDSKEETHILNCYGNTYPCERKLDIIVDKKYWKIKYLTTKEVDLLKLELL